MKTTRLAILIILALATFAPAAQATTADDIMSNIAAHQQMGWKDNKTPMPVLENRIAQGGRVYASCSIVAELGYRAAIAHGIPARHVSAITNDRFDGYNDGHAMVELNLNHHWVLYDLDLNRVAVDNTGHRVGLNHQFQAGDSRKWRIIATDNDKWNFAGTDAKTRSMLAPFANMAPEDWYKHAFGVALVETSLGQYAYHADGHRSARIDAVWPAHYRWVNAATWRTLNR